MRLDQWLAETGTSQTEFARAVGVTQGRISQLARGTGGDPRIGLAIKIEAATDGLVTIRDWGPEREVAG